MADQIIYFIRHGETDWNVEWRFQGQTDIPINARGRAQADSNGHRIGQMLGGGANAYDFVASPLVRTRETMERLRVAMGLPAGGYRTDAALMEVNYGDWEGSTLDEIAERHPDQMARRKAEKWHFLPPGDDAESYAMLAGRVEKWLETVRSPTVCVTHGGVIRSVFHLIEGMTAQEAADLHIHQDRFVLLRNQALSWQ